MHGVLFQTSDSIQARRRFDQRTYLLRTNAMQYLLHPLHTSSHPPPQNPLHSSITSAALVVRLKFQPNPPLSITLAPQTYSFTTNTPHPSPTPHVQPLLPRPPRRRSMVQRRPRLQLPLHRRLQQRALGAAAAMQRQVRSGVQSVPRAIRRRFNGEAGGDRRVERRGRWGRETAGYGVPVRGGVCSCRSRT